jgi:hypothetical protein
MGESSTLNPHPPPVLPLERGGTCIRTWRLSLNFMAVAREEAKPLLKNKAAPMHRRGLDGYSTKLFSFFARLGWRSFLSAFASICRIRSRVTSKS